MTPEQQAVAWATHNRTLAVVAPILGPGRDNGTTTVWGTPEVCFPCPVHGKDKPDSDGLIFEVNRRDEYAPRWWCRKCMPLDGSGKTWQQFTTELREELPEEALSLAAQGSAGSGLRHTPTAVPRTPRTASRPTVEPLPSEDDLAGWAASLANSSKAMPYLVETRLWSPADIAALKIGWHYGQQRFTIPVRDESGTLVNVRRWNPGNRDKRYRWLNWRGHGSGAPLWPAARLANAKPGSRVYLCAGEPDAMAAMCLGGLAVTSLSGEGTPLRPDEVAALAGMHVLVVYDSDPTGRAGAKAAVRALRADGRVASASSRDLFPRRDDGSDLTDWIREGHGLPLPVPTKKRSAA